MAVAAYIHFDPASGSGSTQVNVSADEYSGRVQRQTQATFTVSGAAPATLDITQTGRPEFVQMQATASGSNDGGPVTITGTSNSTKLTFSITEGGQIVGLTVPEQYKANSVDTDNGAEITGDPGANAAYTFEITLQIPDNTGVTELVSQLVVTDAGGHSANCTITQAADAPMISLNPERITLDYTGSAVQVQVTSNTNWTVS